MESSTARQLAAISDELILSAVGSDSRLVDVNPAWERELGWQEGDLLGSKLLRFVAPDDQDRCAQALSVLETGSTVADLRVRMRAVDGIVNVDWRFYRHDQNLYGVGRVLNGGAVESRVQAVLDRHEQKEQDLELQAKAADIAQTKAKTWRTWLLAITSAAGVVGGVLAWTINKIESNVQEAHEAEKRHEQIDVQVDDLKKRADDTDKKFRRVGKILIESQVQVSESTDYVVKKVEAAHPRKTDHVPEPETVGKARDRVDAIRDKQALDQLFSFDENAPDDPFAGMEDETQ